MFVAALVSKCPTFITVVFHCKKTTTELKANQTSPAAAFHYPWKKIAKLSDENPFLTSSIVNLNTALPVTAFSSHEFGLVFFNSLSQSSSSLFPL